MSPPPNAPGSRGIPAAAVARSRVVGEPRWAPDRRHLGWTERRAGAAHLVVATDGGAPTVVTADAPLGGVRHDSGGAWCWAGSDRVVVASGGSLLVLPLTGGASRRITPEGWAGAAHSPAVSVGGLVAYVAETDATCAVAVTSLEGPAGRGPLSDAGWARDPAWSPDGRALVWHEWDEGMMPWDSSRIVLGAADGSPGGGRCVAGGGRDEVAVAQPRFSPDGSALGWVDGRDGWMQLRVAAADGTRSRPVLDEPHDHAEASWGPGMRTWGWSPTGAMVAVCRNEAGFGRLVVASARGRRRARDVARGWHHGIDWGPAGIVAVRSGARTPFQVAVADPEVRAPRRVVAPGPTGFEGAGLVEPESVAWRVGRSTVPGLLYRPAGGGRPPLVVDVHGGPTDQAVVEWRPRVAFWVDRGWAVLRPDHRGSTGHGAAHRRALDGRWGRADVADVAAGIRHAGRAGWCDERRVAVTGASAGGFTALLVGARHPDLVRAVVAESAVTDLADLAARTHRFEARYFDRLVGALPRAARTYRSRSPLTWADRMQVPVLLLHGTDDAVVPVGQAEALAAAVRRAGGTVELGLYPGEGHGISGEAHVVDGLDRAEAFLLRHVLAARRGADRGR